ncbi:MAG: hypothetical protein IKT55_07955 [Clostridia bacterium]|nr:hypothetical protein [Clostridia bacterium]
MKKIKGSLSAIRMSHLVALFVLMTVSGLALRTYQLLVMVNPENGFFENANFAVPVLYGILAVGCVLFLILSFLSKNVPAPKLPEGRNIPLGLASFVAAIGFAWDVITVGRDILPDMSNTMNDMVFGDLLINYIKDNGGVFVVLELIFAVLSVFYFIVFGMSHLEGKATYKNLSLLSIAPGCWAMFMLISKLMKAISFITVSELLFEIGMLVFTMLFFLTFARIVSGVFSVNSMWCTYGCGFPAAIFAGLISVPRGIILAVGRKTVEDSDFSFTHLFLFIFIVVYILSTLGVGFKNSLKKIQSVSNIVLPDDDEVVVKGSAASTDASEVRETEQTGNLEKKKRFSIAPEFKNMGDLDNFFDEEPENDVVENVEKASEVDLSTDEISTLETDNLSADEVVEAVEETTETEGFTEVEETVEEKNLYDTSIPVADISFYQLEDLVNKTETENTVVTEAVEDYEEKVDKKTDEDCDEVGSPTVDTVTSEEDSQEADTDTLEEIEEISIEAYGEDTAEENSEESCEEITEKIDEEINEPDEDDFDFELTAIFSQTEEKDRSPEVAEEVISEAVEEIEFLESFEEAANEREATEVPNEIVEEIGIAEPLGEIVEEVVIPDETEPLVFEDEKKITAKSNSGFLEFSQMLIDDVEDELSVDNIADEEKTEILPVDDSESNETEVSEDVKPEKVKKEKVKKEKVKKEKVKKEKPAKAPKSFGKKKKKEDDEEPLKIVSLADLKNKKD